MKQIKGYPNYIIEVTGHIWSYNRDKYLKHQPHYLGYLQVGLLKNGKRKTFKVHRLLAEHFIPNPNNYKYINHKDGNKSNNDIGNLEWCTHSQNIQHAYDIGLLVAAKGENHSNSKLTESEVKEIRLMTGYFLQKDIAEVYGVSSTQVRNIQNNKQWRHI